MMETRYIRIQSPADYPLLEEAAQCLRCGGIAAIPTETVYGLAGNALDAQACVRIYAAKGRPSDNPLIVHIADLPQWEPLVDGIPDRARQLAEAFWPGPLTIILKKSAMIPDETSGGLATVAVRMPQHPIAREIIRRAGVPLAAPSANTSGRPSPTRAEHVREDLDGKIDYIIDGGPCAVGVESTVITLVDGTPRVLRPGGITPGQIRAVLGSCEVDPAVYEKLREGQTAASPGMKYRHYAPRARVSVLSGSLDSFLAYVNTHADAQGVCALCFDGEGARLHVPFIEYGAQGDPQAQARRLFDALRELDERGARRVYARMPSEEGVGLAVYNRLMRAAAFEVMDLEA